MFAVFRKQDGDFNGHSACLAATLKLCWLLVLALQDEAEGEFMLVVCNAIGSPVDNRHIDIEPKFLAITNLHVIAASSNNVYCWQFRTGSSKFVDASSGKASEGKERSFHIDDKNQVLYCIIMT